MRSAVYGGDTARGQSEIIGYVLVFSIVLVSLGTVSLFGVTALQEVRDTTTASNAEVAMEVLETNVQSVYYGETTGRSTEFTLNSATLETGQELRVDVRVGGSSVGSAPWTLRPIAYRTDDVSIVYENSLVVREDRGGAVAVTEPLFRHTDPPSGTSRTVIPVVRTTPPEVEAVSGGTRRVVARRGTDTESIVETGSPLTVEFELTWSGSSLPPRATVWQETINERIPDRSHPPSFPPTRDEACIRDTGTPEADIVCEFETNRLVVSAVDVEYEFD